MSKQIGKIIPLLIIVIVMFGLLKKWLGGGADQGQLAELIRQGAYLVDVRTPGEFAAGTVKGAVNIPLDSLAQKMAQLKGKQQIVVFCQSGGRSSQAKRILQGNGFTNVTDGGGWQNVRSAAAAQR
jgi:phage shock protein E